MTRDSLHNIQSYFQDLQHVFRKTSDFDQNSRSYKPYLKFKTRIFVQKCHFQFHINVSDLIFGHFYSKFEKKWMFSTKISLKSDYTLRTLRIFD